LISLASAGLIFTENEYEKNRAGAALPIALTALNRLDMTGLI